MKNLIAVLFVLLALFVGVNIGGYFYQSPLIKYLSNITYEVSNDGFSIVEPKINGTTVYLVGECRVISFDVTQDQAYSIQRGIERSVGTRPLTHDIMKDILDVFDVRILNIRIDRYEDDIYFATIFLQRADKALELDARPSDSIAIALRTHTPLYFRSSIMQLKGIYIC
ncbi:MAG: bifunctional nuclease family protein [Candidatus Aenigmatarchaeota archaeon]